MPIQSAEMGNQQWCQRVKAAQRPETAREKGVLPISMCGEWQQKRWMTGQMQNLATTGQGRNSFWEVPEQKVLREKNKLLLETANVRRKMTNVRIISFKKSSSLVRLTMGLTQEEPEIQTDYILLCFQSSGCSHS